MCDSGHATQAAHLQSEQELLAAIMQRCTSRDQRAFAELYERTGAKMYAAAIRIVRREDWAQDVVQESYSNIWTHIEDYRASLGIPLSWMIAIVRNRALDWMRHPYLECGAVNYDELAEAIPDAGPGPEDLLEAKRSAKALNMCLQQLSSNERQAIALAYARGLTHSELARHLDAPIGSVKTWIRRGVAQLRQCIGPCCKATPGRLSIVAMNSCAAAPCSASKAHK